MYKPCALCYYCATKSPQYGTYLTIGFQLYYGVSKPLCTSLGINSLHNNIVFMVKYFTNEPLKQYFCKTENLLPFED